MWSCYYDYLVILKKKGIVVRGIYIFERIEESFNFFL